MLWKCRIFVLTKEEHGLESCVATMLLKVLLVWFNSALRTHRPNWCVMTPFPTEGAPKVDSTDIKLHFLHHLPLMTGQYYLLSSIRKPQFFLILRGNSSEAQGRLSQSVCSCISPNQAPSFLWNTLLFHARYNTDYSNFLCKILKKNRHITVHFANGWFFIGQRWRLATLIS